VDVLPKKKGEGKGERGDRPRRLYFNGHSLPVASCSHRGGKKKEKKRRVKEGDRSEVRVGTISALCLSVRAPSNQREGGKKEKRKKKGGKKEGGSSPFMSNFSSVSSSPRKGGGGRGNEKKRRRNRA